MDFEVIWSDEAIKNLHDICSYIARDNPEAALRMGNGILAMSRFWRSFPSSVRPIPEEHRDRYGKLFSAPIGSFMMYPKNRAEWKSSLFGMLRVTSPHCELPNLAHALDAARMPCAFPEVATPRQ